jgi:hypothetical protein
VRFRLVMIVAAAAGLGLGATALAQDDGGGDLSIQMPRGCLNTTRVTIRITPPDDAILSPVHIRAGNREVVHLTGVTGEASVTVRLPREGRVSVSGESTAGDRFNVARTYHRCSPEAPQQNPSPPITGGGEG